jgi:hypothetical protein
MLSSKKFIDDVTAIVKSLISQDLPGDVKRRKAVKYLKKRYIAFASWLIGAAIELVLGELKIKHPNYFKGRR